MKCSLSVVCFSCLVIQFTIVHALPLSDDLWRRDFEYARDVTPDKVEKPTQSFKTDPNKVVRNSLKTGQDFAVSRDGTESGKPSKKVPANSISSKKKSKEE
jgi:hypothetical protein